MFGAPMGVPLGTLPFSHFGPSAPVSNYIPAPPLPPFPSQQQQQQQPVFSAEPNVLAMATSVPFVTKSSGSVFMSAAPFGASAALAPPSPPPPPQFGAMQGEPSLSMGNSGGFVPGYSSVHNSPQKTACPPTSASKAAVPAPSPLVFGAGGGFSGPAVEMQSPPFSHVPSAFSSTAAPSAFLSASKPKPTTTTKTATTAAASQPVVTSVFGQGSLPERAMAQPSVPSVFQGIPLKTPALSQSSLPYQSTLPPTPVARTRKRGADDDDSSQMRPIAESNAGSFERRDNPWMAESPPRERRPQAHPQQQKQQHQQEKGKSALSLSGKEELLSVRVFAAFMGKILDNNEARREEAPDILDKAFFGVVGSHGGSDFPTVLNQMLSVWLSLKDNHKHVRGEYWVALFALGCHLNYITSTILSGDPGKEEQKQKILDNRWSVISSACTYANIMCDICLLLFASQSENHVPFGVLPLILRRARNTFELACDEGVSSILPNVKTILLKLHRYVRVPLLQQEPSNVVDRQRAMAFAHVLGEMMLHCCAPPESRLFVESFHEHCAAMVETRCTLYHHYAHNLLQEPLTDGAIHQAMELLARALVIVPQSAAENRRLLFVKLTACGLALGRLPSADEDEVEELKDLIVAVRSANLTLFNIAMSNNSELYVLCGIHNVLQGVGKRIALLMVVKYYVVSGMSSRLPLQEMIDYYELPLSLAEASHVWLLPLLVERRINGVIDHGVLILSGANPFDDYTKETLVWVAESVDNRVGIV